MKKLLLALAGTIALATVAIPKDSITSAQAFFLEKFNQTAEYVEDYRSGVTPLEKKIRHLLKETQPESKKDKFSSEYHEIFNVSDNASHHGLSAQQFDEDGQKIVTVKAPYTFTIDYITLSPDTQVTAYSMKDKLLPVLPRDVIYNNSISHQNVSSYLGFHLIYFLTHRLQGSTGEQDPFKDLRNKTYKFRVNLSHIDSSFNLFNERLKVPGVATYAIGGSMQNAYAFGVQKDTILALSFTSLKENGGVIIKNDVRVFASDDRKRLVNHITQNYPTWP